MGEAGMKSHWRHFWNSGTQSAGSHLLLTHLWKTIRHKVMEGRGLVTLDSDHHWCKALAIGIPNAKLESSQVSAIGSVDLPVLSLSSRVKPSMRFRGKDASFSSPPLVKVYRCLASQAGKGVLTLTRIAQ